MDKVIKLSNENINHLKEILGDVSSINITATDSLIRYKEAIGMMDMLSIGGTMVDISGGIGEAVKMFGYAAVIKALIPVWDKISPETKAKMGDKIINAVKAAKGMAGAGVNAAGGALRNVATNAAGAVTKALPSAAEAVGTAAKGARNSILQTGANIATKALPAAAEVAGTAAKGVGMGAKVLSGAKGLLGATNPIGWAFLGLQGVDWLVGKFMPQGVDLIANAAITSGKFPPEQKASLVSTLKESLDAGIKTIVEEEKNNQKNTATEQNEDNTDFSVAAKLNDIRNKLAYSNSLALQVQEKELEEKLLIAYQKNTINKEAVDLSSGFLGGALSILGVKNISQIVADLISEPDLQEALDRTIEPAVKGGLVPEDKKQWLKDELEKVVQKGLETKVEEMKTEETKKTSTGKVQSTTTGLTVENKQDAIFGKSDQIAVDKTTGQEWFLLQNKQTGANQTKGNGFAVVDAANNAGIYDPKTQIVTPDTSGEAPTAPAQTGQAQPPVVPNNNQNNVGQSTVSPVGVQYVNGVPMINGVPIQKPDEGTSVVPPTDKIPQGVSPNMFR